jgi:hypothetical protein
MEFELKGALEKYRKKRSRRRFGAVAFVTAGMTMPWIFSLNQTDTILCWLFALVLWGFAETELRLKTIQIRLAGMADKIDRLSGNDDEPENNNLILELNDW